MISANKLDHRSKQQLLLSEKQYFTYITAVNATRFEVIIAKENVVSHSITWLFFFVKLPTSSINSLNRYTQITQNLYHNHNVINYYYIKKLNHHILMLSSHFKTLSLGKYKSKSLIYY